MPLKVYVAPFLTAAGTPDQYLDFLDRLEADGHTLTYKLLEPEGTLEERRCARFTGICQADAVIAKIAPPTPSIHLDIGIAAGRELFTIVVHDQTDIYVLPNQTVVKDLDEARESLRRWDITMATMGGGSFLATTKGYARIVSANDLATHGDSIRIPVIDNGGVAAVFFHMMVGLKGATGPFPQEVFKAAASNGFGPRSPVAVGTSFEAIFYEMRRVLGPYFQEQAETASRNAESSDPAGDGAAVLASSAGSEALS